MKADPLSGKNVKQLLEEGIQFFAERRIEPAKLLAERLLEGLLECQRFELYLNCERSLAAEQVETYLSYLKKRAEGFPAQYILGRADFMDFTFQVNPSVLIPRPETEFLVEKVLEKLRQARLMTKELRILDVGTGSGNIAISLASYLPKASVWAVDISDGALETARLNAMRQEVAHRIRFVKSDGLAVLGEEEVFDLIVSNPPYLSEKEMREIPVEVRQEPSAALLGGKNGTEFIERLSRDAFCHLNDGGMLFFEMGYEQGNDAARILRKTGWNYFEIFKDYNGHDRVAAALKL